MTATGHLAAIADRLELHGKAEGDYFALNDSGVAACALGAWYLTTQPDAREWASHERISEAFREAWRHGDSTLWALYELAMGEDTEWVNDFHSLSRIADWSDQNPTAHILDRLRNA